METTTETYTDQTVINFGKHKGKALANVPAVYLLWIYNNKEFENPPLKQYILNNMDALNKEASKVKR